MHNFHTFMHKELVESLRTKRLLVLGCVFLFFAITTPLLTRYMGEFFGMVMPAGDEANAAIIAAMSNMSWYDSYIQFYSQLAQIGVWSVLFMYMGTVAREIRTGTASLLFSKGLGYMPFVLAKFVMGIVLVTIVTVVSALVAHLYTYLLFGEAGQVSYVIYGALVFSLGAAALLGIIILCSSLTKSSAAAGGMSFGIYFLMVLFGVIPRIGAYSPTALFNAPAAISLGDFADTLLVTGIVAAVVAIVALVCATRALMRAEG